MCSIFLQRAAIALILFAFPIGFDKTSDGHWAIGVSFAYAESGPGSDGDGQDSRGRGRGRGGDDDRADVDQADDGGPDDSNSGPGSDGGGGDASGNDAGQQADDGNAAAEARPADRSQPQNGTPGLGREFNLTLQYANGWQEWIKDGQYVLIDPQGNTVADRRASRDDSRRMRDLAGL